MYIYIYIYIYVCVCVCGVCVCVCVWVCVCVVYVYVCVYTRAHVCVALIHLDAEYAKNSSSSPFLTNLENIFSKFVLNDLDHLSKRQ